MSTNSISVAPEDMSPKLKRDKTVYGLSKLRSPTEKMFKLMGLLFKPHPWHGLTIGEEAPTIVTAYVECVPGECIKYKLCTISGYLKVDRPSKFSSVCPCIYGFIPQTQCGVRVADRCMEKTKLTDIVGDADPIDICILSTRGVTRGDLLLNTRPIGGFRMIDRGEADDKIISVIKGDPVMNEWKDVSDVPKPQMDLLLHYFLTYKQSPDSIGETKAPTVTIPEIYGHEEAYEMIKRAQEDYQSSYKELKNEFSNSLLNSLKSDMAKALMGST